MRIWIGRECIIVKGAKDTQNVVRKYMYGEK